MEKITTVGCFLLKIQFYFMIFNGYVYYMRGIGPMILFLFQLTISRYDMVFKFDHIRCSFVPMSCDFAWLWEKEENHCQNRKSSESILCTKIRTNPQLLRTPSIMPAENVAQFSAPLSFGTLMNLFTSGSFSMI